MKIEFDSPRGSESVSAVLTDSEACDALLVLAHGAGAGMRHEFMNRMADALYAHRIATLRFQFPFMEHGRKPPNRQPVLTATVVAATKTGLGIAGGRPLYVGGKSMGGRMASLAAAEQRLAGASGLVFFGFPLHPAGKCSLERAAHLDEVDMPMLFLQGTRDRLAAFDAIETVCGDLGGRAIAHKIDGADHGFDFLKSAGRTTASVDREIAAAVREFIGVGR